MSASSIRLPDLDEVGPALLEVLDEDEAIGAFQALTARGFRIVTADDLDEFTTRLKRELILWQESSRVRYDRAETARAALRAIVTVDAGVDWAKTEDAKHVQAHLFHRMMAIAQEALIGTDESDTAPRECVCGHTADLHLRGRGVCYADEGGCGCCEYQPQTDEEVSSEPSVHQACGWMSDSPAACSRANCKWSSAGPCLAYEEKNDAMLGMPREEVSEPSDPGKGGTPETGWSAGRASGGSLTSSEPPSADLPCPHGRPTWRMCPHCLGIGAASVPPSESSEPS